MESPIMATFVYNSSDAAARFRSKLNPGHLAVGVDQCHVRVLEWPNAGCTSSSDALRSTTLSVTHLRSRTEAKLRIIFAPLDQPSAASFHGVQTIFSHYDVPAEFIQERLCNVTHSFAWQKLNDSTDVCWFHTLSKNIEVITNDENVPSIQDPRGPSLSQQDGTWARSGYFLKWKNRPITNDHDETVDLVVFSPSKSLRSNLETLMARADWEQALADPFCLLVVVLEHTFRQMDSAIWDVGRVFSPIERSVLQSADPRAREPHFDFIGIHNIAKHVIYLRESSSAAFSTANHIYQQHGELMVQPQRSHSSDLMQSVHGLLQHKLTLLEVCKLRVETLDSRVKNTISLAFNTVSQKDSQVMKSDSQSMKAIAMVTMFFLPAATIATVCGSQFFNFETTSRRIVVSTDFKYLWIVTLPLTIIVFTVYGLWRWFREKSLIFRAKFGRLNGMSY